MKLDDLIHNFSTIFSNSRDIVNLFSLTQNKVLIQNETAMRAMGYGEGNEQRPIESYYPPGELDRLNASLIRLDEDGHSELRTRMHVQGGEVRELWMRSFIVGREPEVVALVHTIDVTEETRREAATLQASKMAVLGEISSIVAHELNGAIQSVTSNLALLESDAATILSDAARQRLNNAKTGLRSMDLVCRGVHKYAVHRTAWRTEVSASAAVGEALRTLEGFIETRGVTVKVHVTEGAPFAHVDEHHLQQILLVLIKNAVEALEKSHEKRIDLRVDVEDGRVVIEVRDTGPGLPAEIAANLFRPFATIDTPDARGLGLGLSIAKRLADANEIDIACEPAAGIGLRFRLVMPRPGRSHGATALVLADRASTVATIKLAAVNVDTRVLFAATVSECLQILATTPVTMVLCDANAYPISGQAFAEEVLAAVHAGELGFRGPVHIVPSSTQIEDIAVLLRGES